MALSEKLGFALYKALQNKVISGAEQLKLISKGLIQVNWPHALTPEGWKVLNTFNF